MYKQYKIIVSPTDSWDNPILSKFEKEVEKLLAEGWKCQGGVMEVFENRVLYQAMVK